MLRGSLNKGLWVKTPEQREVLHYNGQTFPLKRPIVCFTEWSLSASLPHTSNYGHMGFGFPRRWVLKHGGQPVTYFSPAKSSPFLRAMFDLIEAKSKDGFDEQTERSLDFLLHFAKPTKELAVQSEKKGAATALHPTTATPISDPYKRNPGAPMKFVAEREWRIVQHPSRRFVKNEESEGPQFYLPYKPGKELFTLVLPDNYTVHRVMQDKKLSTLLFPVNCPHVTVISWADIGTF